MTPILRRNEPGEWISISKNSNLHRYASNLDTNMVQLNFYNRVDEPIGILNWLELLSGEHILSSPPGSLFIPIL